MSPAGCPDENDLVLYVQGKLPAERTEQIRGHLDGCEDCRDVIAGIVRAAVPREPDPPPRQLLPRGTNLGRYVLLDPVGEGAMGVVYGAFDPELDRKVALKLLRGDFSPGAKESDRRAHAIAEAQAMARLSHPNVVAVYDVGTYEGEVFLAMEFVRGQSLRDAVAAAPGAWRRTLTLYGQAGSGVAAAHAAGVIHRDFKPDNVLVGEDGRVRVMDFGVAALASAQEAGGILVGTPAYMAPEQSRGEPVDARTDQYAFCASLREGLFGEPSDTEPQPGSPAEGRIPPGVSRVLARGMRPTPAERWPSMAELMSALDKAARRWSPVSLAASVVWMLLAAGLWAQHGLALLQVQADLRAAAERLPQLLGSELALRDSEVGAEVKADTLLEALEHASDVDVALGLASADETRRDLLEAHELIRSADLPAIKRGDAMLVVNGSGQVVYDLADEGSFGQAAPPWPSLRHAMEGAPSDELWSKSVWSSQGVPFLRSAPEEGLLLVSAWPVVRGRAMAGAVLIGTWARPLIERLERALGARVLLRAPDGAPSDDALALIGDVAPGAGMRVVSEGARRFAVVAATLGGASSRTPAGTAYVVRELEASGGFGQGLAAARWVTLVLALVSAAWLLLRAWRFR